MHPDGATCISGLAPQKFRGSKSPNQSLSIYNDHTNVFFKAYYLQPRFFRAILNHGFYLEVLKKLGVVETLLSKSGPTPVPHEQIENVWFVEKHIGNCFYNTEFEVGDVF